MWHRDLLAKATCDMHCVKLAYTGLDLCTFKHSVLTPLQSVFIPGDYTINQLTMLYDTLRRHALDNSREVCDVSKASGSVLHRCLLAKLRWVSVISVFVISVFSSLHISWSLPF